MPSFKTVSLLTIAACAASAGSANADQVSFRYKAYELTSDAGARAVYARMERRAERACNVQKRNLVAIDQGEECTSRLIDDWVNDSQDERLARLHGRLG